MLNKRIENIFYLRSTQEVDFYLPEAETLIQVAYNLQHPETRKRELKGIETMQSQAPVKEALIITYDEEDDWKSGPVGCCREAGLEVGIGGCVLTKAAMNKKRNCG